MTIPFCRFSAVARSSNDCFLVYIIAQKAYQPYADRLFVVSHSLMMYNSIVIAINKIGELVFLLNHEFVSVSRKNWQQI